MASSISGCSVLPSLFERDSRASPT